MQFVVTGRDASDEGALARRMAAREAHIAVLDVLLNEGRALYGVALLDSNQKMVGSTIIFDVASRQELDDILAAEPYVTGNVWETFDVQECKVGPSFVGLVNPNNG